MKVLFVSGSISNSLQKELHEKYGLRLNFAIQKYYKLMEEGFSRNNITLENLSIVPIPKAKAPFHSYFLKDEYERNVRYKYVPYFRFAPFYHFFMMFYVMWRVFIWSRTNRKDGVLLCDTLIPCLCIGASWGSRLASGKRIAWVTDMPGMLGTKCVHYEEMNILGKMQMKEIRRFSGFVFTTLQTNEVLNPFNHPYIVMEGLVDPDIMLEDDKLKRNTRDILYAGSLIDIYGIGALCEAFMRLPDNDLRLVIYGDGPFRAKLEEYALLDQRIDYRGSAPNSEIVDAERQATLLVNPRFTGAEYTLYSYPSKNIEYMVSGTPTITTRLAGIPADHEPYLYFFDSETVDGYYETLVRLLALPKQELKNFGSRAQSYILDNKNAIIQVRRILSFMSTL